MVLIMNAITSIVLLVLSLQTTSTAPQTASAGGEVLTADTPRTTVAGNTFIAPAGWRVEVQGQNTLLTPPEGDSHIALIDLKANRRGECDQGSLGRLSSRRGVASQSHERLSRQGWLDEHSQLLVSDLAQRKA
jgi:hypothetical protein